MNPYERIAVMHFFLQIYYVGIFDDHNKTKANDSNCINEI